MYVSIAAQKLCIAAHGSCIQQGFRAVSDFPPAELRTAGVTSWGLASSTGSPPAERVKLKRHQHAVLTATYCLERECTNRNLKLAKRFAAAFTCVHLRMSPRGTIVASLLMQGAHANGASRPLLLFFAMTSLLAAPMTTPASPG